MRSFLLLTFLLALPSSGGIIFSNFGPGDSFQQGTGESWATGNGVNNGGQGARNAIAFHPGFDAYLDEIRFAANWFAGTNELFVHVVTGDLNSPVVLESFKFSASSQAQSEIFSATSIVRPKLNGGQDYFLVLEVADLQNTIWGWQWNDQGEDGFFSQFNNGPWFVQNDVRPVAEISATAVPEPSSVLLFATAGAALLIRRRAR